MRNLFKMKLRHTDCYLHKRLTKSWKYKQVDLERSSWMEKKNVLHLWFHAE